MGGGRDATRVVFAVIFGQYRLGACRLSAITEMSQRDWLKTGELTIVESAEALPELIIAARSDDAEYYRRKLAGLQARLEAAGGGTNDETERLLRSLGVRRLAVTTPERLARVERLAAAYGGFDASASR